MPHALRFTGARELVAQAESDLLRLLPTSSVVPKGPGLFQVVDLDAVSKAGALPSGWLLYEPTYLDARLPAPDYQQLMRRLSEP
jgi:hypothetical protein